MIREAEKQEKENRDYRNDSHLEQVPHISGRVRNIQVNLIVGLPTPMINQTSHTDPQNVYLMMNHCEVEVFLEHSRLY